MAEEQNKESVLGGLRSRLPKFPAKSGANEGDKSPIRSTSPSKSGEAVEAASTTPVSAASANPASGTVLPLGADAVLYEDNEISVEEAHLQHLQYIVEEFGQVQGELQRMYRLVEEISERESAQEKVFNTLHAELRDYKNDFIYEHLKPVVRPLLFLYDSLEQFDAEIALYERPNSGERRQSGLSPQLVRENISFFRDQLIEALRICEVTRMETPKGAFNPRLHKVIDVVPAEADQDGMIQRIVRSGWYLNGALLRSAEVIVGKKMS
jgi:molecular chaperone GrpE (heat shock protein)